MITEILENAAIFLQTTSSKLSDKGMHSSCSLFKKRNYSTSGEKELELLYKKTYRLTSSLYEAINEIENTVEKKQEFTKELEEKANKAKAISEMSQEQVDAIAELLENKIREEGKKSDKKALISNIIFCIIGIIGGHLFTLLVNYLREHFT